MTSEEIQQLLEQEVPYVQNLYNQFKNIGVTISISDVPTLISKCRNGGSAPFFDDIVNDKLLALSTFENVMALGLSRGKTLELVSDILPKYESIKTWIRTAPMQNSFLQYADKLQIVGDVVSIIPVPFMG